DAVGLRRLPVLRLQCRRERVQRDLRLPRRPTGPHPRDGVVAVRGAAAELRAPFERQPDIGAEPRIAVAEEPEPGGHDADDLDEVRRAAAQARDAHGVQFERQAVERTRAELATPVLLPDEGDGGAAGPVLVVAEAPAVRRPHAERLEETARDASESR